jgi:hypothetical protein
MRRFTMLALAALLSLLPATVWGQDQGQSPPNWFRVSWQPGVLPSTIEGQVQNTSPFRAIDVRVQIEGVDAENHSVGQRLVWLSDDIAPGGTTSYFSESILGAVGYRVSVASFELVSGGEAVIDAESGPSRPGE